MSDSEVLIGGERMVALRGTSLIPAELEVTATAGDRYRRASEFLAQLTEQGRAPWMIARDPGCCISIYFVISYRIRPPGGSGEFSHRFATAGQESFQ